MKRTDQQKKERNIREKSNREYLKSIHRCRDCKKIDAYTLIGRTFCADCVARNTELKKENRDKERDKEIQKNIREKRKEEHKCSRCGKQLGREYTYSTCDLCRKKMREKKKIRHEKITQCNLPRGDNGICWQCNKEPCIEGKHLCKICYDNKMKLLEKANEANKREKEFIWVMAAIWMMRAEKYEQE